MTLKLKIIITYLRPTLLYICVYITHNVYYKHNNLEIWASNKNCVNEAIKLVFKNIQQKGINRKEVKLSCLKKNIEQRTMSSIDL